MFPAWSMFVSCIDYKQILTRWYFDKLISSHFVMRSMLRRLVQHMSTDSQTNWEQGTPSLEQGKKEWSRGEARPESSKDGGTLRRTFENLRHVLDESRGAVGVWRLREPNYAKIPNWTTRGMCCSCGLQRCHQTRLERSPRKASGIESSLQNVTRHGTPSSEHGPPERPKNTKTQGSVWSWCAKANCRVWARGSVEYIRQYGHVVHHHAYCQVSWWRKSLDSMLQSWRTSSTFSSSTPTWTLVAFVTESLSPVIHYHRTLGNMWDSLYNERQLRDSDITSLFFFSPIFWNPCCLGCKKEGFFDMFGF